jgi:phenolic acid decarboxylase
MSATSSVFNFRYENGRRYHAYAEGQYPVPNDEVCNYRVRSSVVADTVTRWKRTAWISSTTPSDSHWMGNYTERQSPRMCKTCST